MRFCLQKQISVEMNKTRLEWLAFFDSSAYLAQALLVTITKHTSLFSVNYFCSSLFYTPVAILNYA